MKSKQIKNVIALVVMVLIAFIWNALMGIFEVPWPIHFLSSCLVGIVLGLLLYRRYTLN